MLEKKAEEYKKKYKTYYTEGYNTSLVKRDYMKKITTISLKKINQAR